MVNKKAKTIKIIAIITAIIIFLLLGVLVYEFVNIFNLKKKETMLKENLYNLEQEVFELTNENDYKHSSEFLEDYARETLNWGKNGEIIYK